MKRLVFVAVVAIAIATVSCNNEGGMSAAAKKNLEAAQGIAKMFESGDWSKIGDYIAADAVDHAGMNGDAKGLEAIKANFAHMAETMSDFKNDVQREFADDEYVAQWIKESATAKTDDPMMGMKAGSRNTFNSVEISKFKDGKIIEHWSFVDWNDMMKMMPKPPGMDNMPMMDHPKDSTGAKMEKK